MKKVTLGTLAFLLVSFISLALVSCGNDTPVNKNENPVEQESVVETTETTEVPTQEPDTGFAGIFITEVPTPTPMPETVNGLYVDTSYTVPSNLSEIINEVYVPNYTVIGTTPDGSPLMCDAVYEVHEIGDNILYRGIIDRDFVQVISAMSITTPIIEDGAEIFFRHKDVPYDTPWDLYGMYNETTVGYYEVYLTNGPLLYAVCVNGEVSIFYE